MDGDLGSGVRLAPELKARLVHRRGVLDDGKAEARAAELPGMALVHAVKPLEHPVLVLFRIAMSRDTDDDITLRRRSVMGIEIPDVKLTDDIHMPGYGFSSTNPLLDETYIDFMKVRDLVAKAAAIENSVYRLAKAIKQSQKRANALKNIVIPDLEEQIHYITGYLEEKERDEFTTLKVVKGRK